MFRPAVITLLAILSTFTLHPEQAIAAVAPKIAAGYGHTVALTADGTVKQWGTTADWVPPSTVPVTVTGLGNTVTAIAAGSYHTLALLADGTVKAWGDNSWGQLGDGTTSNRSTPVTVIGLGGPVTAIAAGSSYSLALMADGTVKAWGAGYNTTPMTVTGLAGRVTAIAAGYHILALLEDGTVQAWGGNSYGQLGDGTTTSSSTPVSVTGLNGTATAIAAGYGYSLVVLADGTLKAWGRNDYGQLGDGSTANSNVPLTVSALTGKVLAIFAGERHSLALMEDGTVRSWGGNEFGQLGDGTVSERSSYPVPAFTGTAAAIAAGTYHSVLIQADGTVMAWGKNSAGQLGNGTTTDSAAAITVTGLDGAAAGVAAAVGVSLALMNDGSIRAWGNNYDGMLGNGSTVPLSTSPVPVSGLSGTVAAMATGYNHVLALLSDGTLMAWGDNMFGELGNEIYTYPVATPVPVLGLEGTVTAIAAGYGTSLALMADGTVKAWGNNWDGQLGNGTITDFYTYTPVSVTGLEQPAIAIAAGGGHSLALMADGTVKAWGKNNTGQLGDGTTADSNIPVTVTGLGGPATAIAAGPDYSVALMADGTIKEWGWHTSWDGTNGTPPRTITGFNGTVTAIAAGSSARNVALMADGTVMEWGYGWGQQRDADTAVPVAGLSQVMAVAAGSGHSLAVMADGTVKGWGENDSGQLGIGNWTLTPQPALINVDNVIPAVTVVDKQPGTYSGSIAVTLSCSDNFSGCAAIHYTLDGSNPTTSSPVAAGPVSISATSRLKAISVDGAGNASLVHDYHYTIISGYTLTVTAGGQGNGSYTTLTNDGYGTQMWCGQACSFAYAPGSVVNVVPRLDTDWGIFAWSGCDSVSGNGNVCKVTMTGERSVVATWAPLTIQIDANSTDSISTTYAALPEGGMLKLEEMALTQNLLFDRNIAFTLKGGYAADFLSNPGSTTIHGELVISRGTMTVQNVVIAP